MKSSNKHMLETLIINKDYSDGKIVVKSFDELRNIIEDRYEKLGPGTKENPIDFNDIDVSNIYYFIDRYKGGIFEGTKFKYIDISYWDVSSVTDMSYMFYICKELESVGDISSWNLSNVEDMNSMFYECKELETVGDISKWNVSNVTNMSFMFYNCVSLNQDISSWNVSKVKYKIDMFDKCSIKDKYKPKFKI